MAAEDIGCQGTATVHIEAPPEKVYALVADVTRMGEWSPETYKAEWIEGATGPAVGARFKGSNKQGIFRWSTRPTVTVAEPGKEFTFETGRPGREDTRWSYTLTPKDGGTDLTESFEALRYPGVLKVIMPPKKRAAKLQGDIERTLQRIKAAAEGSA
jgi:uncharacterized protein YndB with AHSA1/START domain